MTTNVNYTDKLKDRGFIDQWGFMLFAALGFFGIVVAKSLNANVVVVSVGAVVIMLLYATLLASKGTGRLRADQAGDNCYYLGLIFTLASLAHAIFTFNPDDTAGTIVQGFGIALATTILGLVLRVAFNQGRPDMEHTEQQVRLEFMEATSKLRTELSLVVQSTNDMNRQLQQAMQEIQRSARDSIEEFGRLTKKELQDSAQAASALIEAQTTIYLNQAESHKAATEQLVAKLWKLGDSLEPISEAHIALTKVAEQSRDAAEMTHSAVAGLPKSLAAVSDTTQATAKAAGKVVAGLTSELSQLKTEVQGIIQAINGQFKELIEIPSVSAQQLADASSQIYSDLSGQAKMALTTVQKNNENLELELNRSQKLVSKVHKSLVEMTDKLATTLEPKI